MDRKTWDDLALAAIDRLKPQIDPKWVAGIDLEIAGGEYAMAIQDLVGVLADDQVAVTAEDRDELRRLISDLGEPTEDLDRLNVQQNPPHRIAAMTGEQISEIHGDGRLTLSTSGRWLVTIESEMVIARHGARIPLSSDAPHAAAFLRDQLAGATIAQVVARSTGSLVIETDDGIKLKVQSNADYEAWSIVGPEQQRFVSMPDGELAVWSRDSAPDS